MSFRIKLKENIDTVVEKVKSKVAENGGTFDWNGSVGQLSGKSPVGKIKATCKAISSQEIEVSITDKPFIVTEGMIKKQIEEYLG